MTEISDIRKKAIMISHNNTHSLSRIYRSVELIRRKNPSDDIEELLKRIVIATTECRYQVDELYQIITKTDE